MIYSNKRKLALSGWFNKEYSSSYKAPLKFQKFLFFYEALCKVTGEKADFSNLKGYQKGPVFSNVWGDYIKESDLFLQNALKTYNENKGLINTKLANKSAFIVNTLTDEELSDLTHKMNIWKSKKDRILNGEFQAVLNESDFNDADDKLIKTLCSIYSDEMINDSIIINLDNKYFVLPKSQQTLLTEKHYDILLSLTKNKNLMNPIFIEIDEEVRMLID